MTRILVTLVLSVYNNIANLWPPFNRGAYVPTNLAAAGVLAATAVGPLGLTGAEIGVGELSVIDFAIGLAIGAAIGAVLLVLAHTDRWAPRVADRRVAGLRGRMLAYQVFVRVPVGTALVEELAFRGVLFAAWRDQGVVAAALISSAVFGLWHIVPAGIMARTNAPDSSTPAIVRTVVVTVLLTTAAGLGLVWVRSVTDSLAAPFALHAAVNSLATWAAVLASPRSALQIQRNADQMHR